MKTLKQKWGKFLGIILGPGSVLFSVLAIVSLILAFAFKVNTLFATLLSVLGSVLAGIAGSFIKDDYVRLATENVLEKKGRSALRNLDAIREQIVQIRAWIASFKNIGKEGEKALQEVDRHLSTIMLNTSAGLADWVDVVPELQERAEVAKKQEEVLKAYVEELLENKKELVISKDENRVTELKHKITDLEKQIKDIRKKGSWSDAPLITASGIGYGGDCLISSLSSSVVKNCQRCGSLFMSGNGSETLCPGCRMGGGGLVINSIT